MPAVGDLLSTLRQGRPLEEGLPRRTCKDLCLTRSGVSESEETFGRLLGLGRRPSPNAESFLGKHLSYHLRALDVLGCPPCPQVPAAAHIVLWERHLKVEFARQHAHDQRRPDHVRQIFI